MKSEQIFFQATVECSNRIFRKNLDFVPEGGFQMESALTREEALTSMTLWAAKASFEDGAKGSIEPGKYADFVVLDRDIMTADEKMIPGTKVLMTFVAGELVYNYSLLP